MAATSNIHHWTAIAFAWLIVIFYVAALGTPQFISRNEDNGFGGFRYCMKDSGTGCRDYPSSCSSLGDQVGQFNPDLAGPVKSTCDKMKATGAMTLLALLITIVAAGATSVAACLEKGYLHVAAVVGFLIGAVFGLIAMAVCASAFNDNKSFYEHAFVSMKLGPSFALVVVSWILELSLIPYYFLLVNSAKTTT